jgi:hypothetical protein
VSFSHVHLPEFSVPTHNIHGMIISEKNSESKLMFLECTVAAIWQHYHFWENEMKSGEVFGMYSSGNLPTLQVPLNLQQHALGKWGMLVKRKRWREGTYGLCDWEGVGAVKREMNVNLNQSRVFIKVHAAFVCIWCHSFTCTKSARVMNRIFWS